MPFSAEAAPAVLLEETRLVPADGAPAGGYGRSVAVDGNLAVVTANAMSTIHGSSPDLPGAAYVFERDGLGVWRQGAKLTPGPAHDGDLFGIDVAIEDDVIAVGAAFSRLTHVFERQGASWVRTAVLGGGGPGEGSGFSVAIENGVIAVSQRAENGVALYRRGASGWARIASFANGMGPGGEQDFGPQVGITDEHAIHGSWRIDTDPASPSTAYIYTARSIGDWSNPTVTPITRTTGDGFPDRVTSGVAIAGNTALISEVVYERTSGVWRGSAAVLGGSALNDQADTVSGLLPPFRFSPFYLRGANQTWPHRGELATSDSAEITAVDVDASNIVAASYPNAAYAFEMPATVIRPELRQDDFQDGDAAGWTTLPGSLFAVANAGRSLVYRQASVAGNAAALWPGPETSTQAIQADITPRAFDGADRWFGLVVRYADSNNYYYVTARSSGSIQLKRMLGGTFTTLGSAPLPVTLNRTHRLRLEAVDDHVRVFVNERPVIRVRDAALGGGQPGVMMFKTRADYDNVLVNANPAYIAFAEDFEVVRRPMQEDRGQWSRVMVNGSWVRRQSDLSGGARSLILGAGFADSPGTFGDQVVQADLRIRQFSGADRWVGLLAHYLDENNHHYVTLRSSGVVSLRRLVNGQIQTLASTSYPVTTNVTYRVRLETVGTRMRAFVNEVQVLEASDATLTRRVTSAGVGMYKAAADVDNFSVLQP